VSADAVRRGRARPVTAPLRREAPSVSPIVPSVLRSPMARRTMATWVALIGILACVFLARTLIARSLGPSGIGLYALMLTAAWLGGTVISAGLPAYNGSFAGSVQPGILLANSIAWNVAAAAILSLVCIPALTASGIPLAGKVMIVGVLMAPLMSLLECIRGILQGMGAIAPYNWLGLASGALNLLAVGILVATSRLTLGTAIASWIVSTLLSAAASVRFGAAHMGGLAAVDRRVLIGSLKFGAQAWLSQLSWILNFRIALLLTGWLFGTAAVGLYAIAVTIVEVMFYFPNALAVVSSPRYAAATRAEARALLKRSSVWVLTVSSATAIALAVVSGPLIRLVFGSAYAESSRLLVILLPGVVAYTPVAVGNWYFNAHVRRPIVNLVIAGFSAILNGTLTLIFAPVYGLAGVAWSATAAYMAASLLSVVLIRRLSPTT